MTFTRIALSAALAATLTACASTPTGPSVMVLPGKGKSLEQFQTEDGRCRQAAAGEVERTKGGGVSGQKRYDMTYLQCMYTQGNQVPVSGRAGVPANVPPPPAGTPPPPPPSSGTPPPPPPSTSPTR